MKIKKQNFTRQRAAIKRQRGDVRKKEEKRETKKGWKEGSKTGEKLINLPIIAARTKRLSRLQTIIFTPRGVGKIL